MITLMEGEWSLLQRWPVYWKENGHVREVVSLMEGEWSCYRGGQFNGGRRVMLQRWTLMEGEWSCYRGGQFNGGRMVMLRRWSV